MSTQSIVKITFFVSVLVFNPAVADALYTETTLESRVQTSTIQRIASMLYSRGLDEEVARERAAAFVGEDEEAFAAMLERLLAECRGLDRERLFDYLAEAALYRREISLHAYDHLLRLYQEVQGTFPDEATRDTLAAIARKNYTLLA